ncbi:MAG: Uma2 family endonuclease [Bacteroidota bacterium]
MSTITEFSKLDLDKTYSYADYLTWRFQDRVELIKGKVFKMTPAPSRGHQGISIALSAIVWNHFRGNPCQVYEAPFDVRLSKNKTSDKNAKTVVQPDLCVICDPEKTDDRGCNGAPDLVVEILSPGNSKREMREKFEAYEESGVREYWIVNAMDKNVIIYLLNDQGIFVGLKPFIETDELVSSIFPELKIDLVEVFENG